MRNSQARMNDLTLTVKCLKCKSTSEFKNVSVTLDAGGDFDFECYVVAFDHSDGTELYLQDLLCDDPCPLRFSAFGRLSTGDMFALPCVVREWNFGSFRWITRPDRNGAHLAMKPAEQGASA